MARWRLLKRLGGRDTMLTDDDLIATNNLGAGVADSTKYLSGDQTWEPLTDIPVPSSVQAALDEKLDKSSIFAADKYFSQFSAFSPNDGAIVYFGADIVAPTTTSGIRRIYIRSTGVINIVDIRTYAIGGVGSNESWSLYLSVNGTDEYLVSAVASNTSERVFLNTSMNSGLGIAVSANDFFELKFQNPIWATNPLTVVGSGYIYVQPDS